MERDVFIHQEKLCCSGHTHSEKKKANHFLATNKFANAKNGLYVPLCSVCHFILARVIKKL